MIPDTVSFVRQSDSRILFSASVDDNHGMPSVSHIWQDPDLTEILGGEIWLSVLGRPVAPRD